MSRLDGLAGGGKAGARGEGSLPDREYPRRDHEQKTSHPSPEGPLEEKWQRFKPRWRELEWDFPFSQVRGAFYPERYFATGECAHGSRQNRG